MDFTPIMVIAWQELVINVRNKWTLTFAAVFSVLALGISSAAACLFNLEELIKALIILQIFVQSIAQIGAVALLRRREEVGHPFRMWLYPLPCLLALAGWIYILASNEAIYVVLGAGLFAAGALAYLWRARTLALWPFERPR